MDGERERKRAAVGYGERMDGARIAMEPNPLPEEGISGKGG